MTTIAAGASATITVAPGGQVAVASNGGIWVSVETPVVGSVRTANHGPTAHTRIFGPYAQGATLVITNQSVNAFNYVDYEVGATTLGTIAVGANQTFTLTPQGTLSVSNPSGYWQVSVTPAIGNVSTAVYGPGMGNMVFGPYQAGATVVVTNQTGAALVTSMVTAQYAFITGTIGGTNVLTANVSASVTATSWQWTRNGSNIGGATTSTYTQVPATDAGTVIGVSINGGAFMASVSIPAIAPVFSAAPTITAATTTGVTFTAATLSNNGTPTSTVTHDLYDNGALVASNYVSGGTFVVGHTMTLIPYAVQGGVRVLTGPTSAGFVVTSASTQYLGQVATRTFAASSPATANYVNAMSGHYATENLSGWQTKWPAWYVLQNAGLEIASTAPFTITASVEYPVGGARTQLTWSGSASVQPTLGSDTGLCDPVAVPIPAGALFILHYFASVNSGTGGGLPVTACISGQNMGFSTNDAFEASVTTLTDKTMSGTPAAGSTFYVYPLCIVQQTTNPSFFINGDSRTFGATSGGTIVDANGCMGQITRSLGKTSAWINAAISGTTLAQFNFTGGRRAALAQYCSHIINAMGVNDIRAASGGSARSAAQFVGDAIAGTKMFPAGKTFIACTMSNADTATTDAWATTVNQTPDTNAAQILSANSSLAALPAPYAYCVDIAGQTNDTTIATAWKAPGFTADGLHGVKAAYDLIVSSGIINGTTLGALKGSGFYSIYTANPGILWLDFGNPGSKYSATTFAAISAAGGSFYTQSGTTAQSSSAWPTGNGYAVTIGSSGSNYILGSQPVKDVTSGIAAITFAAILQYTAAPVGKGPVIAVSTTAATNERAVLNITTAGFPSLTYRRQDADAATTITSAVPVAVNTPVMLEAQLDAANNVVTLYQNGVSVATGTFVASAAVTFTATSAALVACGSFNGTQLGMALREANILPFVQTLTQRQKMEGDMAWRAGVAATVLPAGHPYLSAAPTS